MRKIIVYSTRGQKGSFDSDAKTWGEITSEVENIVGDLGSLIATENTNKTDLGHEDAKLPEGDFKIFLRPSKIKSGAVDFKSMSFKELRNFISEKGQDCKDALNIEAKKTNRNWTQLGTKELVSILSKKYTTSSSNSTTKKDATSKKVVTSKKVEKKEEISEEDLKKEFAQLRKGFM